MPIIEQVVRPSLDAHGHQFDVLTRACDCGMTEVDLFDASPRRPAPTHDDMLNPGTVAATHRQRSTGRVIHYRKKLK